MVENQLSVYKASAGSGKTFTLAVEYIALVVENPGSYKNILGVTFTNKATAEMKNRIITQLYGITTEDPLSKGYLDAVRKRLSAQTESQIISNARRALTLLLHDYDRFKIETIDSFFQTVLRNLARELGLGAAFNIELDTKKVLEEAVDKMFRELSPSSDSFEWISDFIEEKIADGKQWKIEKELVGFGYHLFNEEVMAGKDGLHRFLQNKNSLKVFRKTLLSKKKESADKVIESARQLLQVLDENCIGSEDLIKGMGTYLQKLEAGDVTGGIPGANVIKALEDPLKWPANKKHSRYGEIVSLAQTTFQPMLAQLEKSRSQESQTVATADASLCYLNVLGLLTDIDDQIRKENISQNRFLLPDTAQLLSSMIQEGDPAFIYEKIGSVLTHIMLDEFQDTSAIQWKNFQPLLKEALSNGGTGLIVGDVKQSIYRWRSGDWRILEQIENTKGLNQYPIHLQHLQHNYRSLKNIIHFNNEFFASASGCFSADMKKAYSNGTQISPKERESGWAKVVFLAEEKSESTEEKLSYKEKTLIRLVEEVEELQKSGVDPDDICILVRVNKNIPLIAQYFSSVEKERGEDGICYSIVSDEAFELGSSAVLKLIIAATAYLTDLRNNIALAELCALRGVSFENPQQDSAIRDLIEKRDELRQLSLFELTERLITLWCGESENRESGYLFSYMDHLTAFCKEEDHSLRRWIDYWDEQLSTQTIVGSGVKGVRIFSIHKSKGLEFHTVVIPFCDWGLEPAHNLRPQIWVEPKEAPYNQIPLLAIPYKKELGLSLYQEQYLQEQELHQMDNLNLLYVGFTRAEANLIVLTKQKKKREELTTTDDILFHTVKQMAQRGIGSWNEQQYLLGNMVPSEKKETEGLFCNRLLSPSTEIEVPFSIFKNERIGFKPSHKAERFLSSDQQQIQFDRLNRGNMLHRLFEQIGTIDDITPAVETLFCEGWIQSQEEKEELIGWTRMRMENSSLSDLFSPFYRQMNECSLLSYQNGELITKRPDKIFIKEDQVVVLDFKFGRYHPHYEEQIRTYMTLLQGMGYRSVKGFLWFVPQNEVKEIVNSSE